ncbi:MAG: tRNA (adenosine(37)-N6)-threonylcarbamoyltransferase complex ATPase subunit type 1 TsaE [Deltaproteobacteria bacterium]|nr:tRNA (adenosine(37)-N6)-threonylcarbamoyltransferase complex ATPase subunit type 1 TsaE [Deltaproteobacteria bacterium]
MDVTQPGIMFFTLSRKETRILGRRLANLLRKEFPPDEPLTIALSGPLGAGKTTFVKGFGKALGIAPKDIVSPTFGLATVYEEAEIPFVHLDLYRLGAEGQGREAAAREFREAGLEDALRGWALVEWPEKLPDSFWRERVLKIEFNDIQDFARKFKALEGFSQSLGALGKKLEILVASHSIRYLFLSGFRVKKIAKLIEKSEHKLDSFAHVVTPVD